MFSSSEILRMLWFRESIPIPKDDEDEATDWLESCRSIDAGAASAPPGWTLGPGCVGSSKFTLFGEDATDIEDMLLCLESDRWKVLAFSS